MTISLLWHRRVTAPRADPLRLFCGLVQGTAEWPSRRRGFEIYKDSPRQVWPNRVRLRYGLEFLLRLLSTFPHGNAVTTVGYRAVTLPWSGLTPN
jgi:hypothetical protein